VPVKNGTVDGSPTNGPTDIQRPPAGQDEWRGAVDRLERVLEKIYSGAEP
jgi:hypothetical protein